MVISLAQKFLSACHVLRSDISFKIRIVIHSVVFSKITYISFLKEIESIHLRAFPVIYWSGYEKGMWILLGANHSKFQLKDKTETTRFLF